MAFDKLTHWQIYDETGRRKYVREDERARFLEAAQQLDLPMQLLCEVLAFTGCRVSEALNLHRHQLDTERLTLTIRTLKRRRTVFRVIHIPEPLAAALARLPPHSDGRFWVIHRTTAWRIVKRLMDMVHVTGPMACCKGLRHGFGIRAAGRNVPEGLIQRWMGHSSRATTAVYLDAVGCEERAFAMRLWSQ
ncbi:MAG: site-specific integrase [Proteobacteria bacterium]|nr:site-specific integrase [Pseudomonadota bacterium]